MSKESGQQQPQCPACALKEQPQDLATADSEVREVMRITRLSYSKVLYDAAIAIWRLGWRAGVHAGWLAACAAGRKAQEQAEREAGNGPVHPALAELGHGPHGGH